MGVLRARWQILREVGNCFLSQDFWFCFGGFVFCLWGGLRGVEVLRELRALVRIFYFLILILCGVWRVHNSGLLAKNHARLCLVRARLEIFLNFLPNFLAKVFNFLLLTCYLKSMSTFVYSANVREQCLTCLFNWFSTIGFNCLFENNGFWCMSIESHVLSPCA